MVSLKNYNGVKTWHEKRVFTWWMKDDSGINEVLLYTTRNYKNILQLKWVDWLHLYMRPFFLRFAGFRSHILHPPRTIIKIRSLNLQLIKSFIVTYLRTVCLHSYSNQINSNLSLSLSFLLSSTDKDSDPCYGMYRATLGSKHEAT